MTMGQEFVSRDLFDGRLDLYTQLLKNDKEAIEMHTALLNEITKAVERLVTREESRDKIVEGHSERITELEKRPGRRMDTIIANVITGVIMLVIGAVFGYVMRGF